MGEETRMTPLLQAFSDASAPPHDGPIEEWCAAHVDLPGAYVPSGKFRPHQSPWLLPVLSALKDEKYRIVNVLKPTGTGGTLCADLFVAWCVVNRPGNIQWNWNIESLATGHCEERLWPLIDACPPARALYSDNRHELRTLARKFKTGQWLRIQAGTESRLQGKHIPIQINDEVWQWDAGRMREADSRLGAYRRVGMSKQLNISQGGDVGSEWHIRCMAGERVEWRVPCPHCGEFFFPKLEDREAGKAVYRVEWDSSATAAPEEFSNVRMICASCRGEMRDGPELKAMWKERGRIESLTPGLDADSITIRWSPFVVTPWAEIVADYRRAIAARKLGVLLPLRQFIQKVMADFWDEGSETSVEPVDLRVSDYKPGVAWQVEHKPALTVDCQRNLSLFYLVVRGWASNGGSRRLFRGRVNSFDEIAAVQRQFNVSSPFVALDVGYEQTPILQECARRIDDGKSWGWFGMKGNKDDQGIGFNHETSFGKTRRIYSPNIWPDLGLGQRNHNVDEWLATLSEHVRSLYRSRAGLRIPIVMWSNRLTYEILARLRDGRGAEWMAPADESGQDEERHYREQLGAKILRDSHDSRGHPVKLWESIRPNFPDHYWDCECEQVVIAAMMGALIGV